jgi:hypothetical protein
MRRLPLALCAAALVPLVGATLIDQRQAACQVDNRPAPRRVGWVPNACADLLMETLDCSERMEAYETCDARLDRKVDEAANKADEAAKAVEQLTAMISASPPEGADGGAGARLDVGALREALTVAQTKADQAQSDLQEMLDARTRFAAQEWATCVPSDAVGLTVSAAAGTGWASVLSLNGSWRHRIGPRISSELALGYVASSRGVFTDARSPSLAAWNGDALRSWTLSASLRYGRGNWGEIYWGPALGVTKTRSSDDFGLALGGQVGYSLSPHRHDGQLVGTDFRLFLQPWFPVDGHGALVLFGFGFGPTVMWD